MNSNKKGQNKNKSSTNQPSKDEVIDDTRFKSIYKDPRFKQIKSANTKVTVDKRFEKVFDKKFTGEQSTGVDAKGRKVTDDSGVSEMAKYYKLQKDEDIEDKLERLNRLARGEGSDNEGSSDNSSEDSSSDEESESDDFDTAYIDEELQALETQDQNIDMGEETNRLACVNLDWSRIKAVDLFSVFNSFVGDGTLLSVSIYLSEFGKERIKNEEKYGPEGHQVLEDNEEISDEEETNEDIMEVRLRQYERSRLKYYFCIIECDTIFAANNIYSNCDGTEYQVSGNIFDLRYVPEGTKFNKEDMVDRCTYIPLDYAPHSNRQSSALSKTKVDLSWDKEDEDRSELMKWSTLSKPKVSKKKSNKFVEVDEADLQQYIASDNENNEEDDASDDEKNAQKLREKYLQLLKDKNILSNTDAVNTTSSKVDEDTEDKEVTFVPGLEKQLKDKVNKQKEEEKGDSNAYEKYKQIMREKRKQRRDQKDTKDDDKDIFEDDKDDMNDPFFATSDTQNKKNKKAKKGKKVIESEAEKKQKAELDLMLMQENSDDNFLEDEDEDDHYMNKRKKKTDNDTFDINLNDDRFKSLYTDSNYHIDPTSNQYSKTNNMNKLIGDISKKRKKN